MSEVEGENGRISFTTKELLSRIEGKLDMLASQLQQKADLSSVIALSSQVQQLERDMQEGKETVKSMLIPDYHAFKEAADRELRALEDRLRGAELGLAKLAGVAGIAGTVGAGVVAAIMKASGA